MRRVCDEEGVWWGGCVMMRVCDEEGVWWGGCVMRRVCDDEGVCWGGCVMRRVCAEEGVWWWGCVMMRVCDDEGVCWEGVCWGGCVLRRKMCTFSQQQTIGSLVLVYYAIDSRVSLYYLWLCKQDMHFHCGIHIKALWCANSTNHSVHPYSFLLGNLLDTVNGPSVQLLTVQTISLKPHLWDRRKERNSGVHCYYIYRLQVCEVSSTSVDMSSHLSQKYQVYKPFC